MAKLGGGSKLYVREHMPLIVAKSGLHRDTSNRPRCPLTSVQSFLRTLTQISPALETFGWNIFVVKNPAEAAGVRRHHFVKELDSRADVSPPTHVSLWQQRCSACHPVNFCAASPLGGAEGNSSPRTSFMQNLPPSYGVPAANAGATQTIETCSGCHAQKLPAQPCCSAQRSSACVSQCQWSGHGK